MTKTHLQMDGFVCTLRSYSTAISAELTVNPGHLGPPKQVVTHGSFFSYWLAYGNNIACGFMGSLNHSKPMNGRQSPQLSATRSPACAPHSSHHPRPQVSWCAVAGRVCCWMGAHQRVLCSWIHQDPALTKGHGVNAARSFQPLLVQIY